MLRIPEHRERRFRPNVNRAWEVMQAKVGTALVPSDGAREWVDGLPFAG